MTRPRYEQVSIDDTPYYHIVSRCVRRAFLCGIAPLTSKSYEHRRAWIEDRIRLLSSIFAVDICAHAIMSNHIHLLVKLNPVELEELSPVNIAQRWSCFFKGPLLLQKWLRDSDSLDEVEGGAVSDIIEVYRQRLSDLGWFIKCSNEPVARQAKREDNCTGYFWESRYKSQPVLSEEALLSCMACVDLNPVRAGVAHTPETSSYASIKERIEPTFKLGEAVKKQIDLDARIKFDVKLKPLARFEGGISKNSQCGILYGFKNYLQLVDLSVRCIMDKKTG